MITNIIYSRLLMVELIESPYATNVPISEYWDTLSPLTRGASR